MLRQHRITKLNGITIPRLLNQDYNRQLIQIDVVSPPFLLDFAGVKFVDPEFPADTMAQYHANIERMFGPNAHIAYSVQYQLQRIGMFYLDLRQSNLDLRGLPGLLPDDTSTDDEF